MTAAFYVVDDDPKVLDMHVRMLEQSVMPDLAPATAKRTWIIARQEKLALILLEFVDAGKGRFRRSGLLREEEINRTTR
jgi:hypothetical protein